MKKISIIALFLVGLFTQNNAQTADEIINSYFETIGGKAKLEAVNGTKMKAKMNQGGMEIPIEVINFKDGRQMISFTLQGKTIKEEVFDGEVLWGTNFLTQKPEKSTEEETENFKKNIDFPDPFLNYKEKGYEVELIGKEEFETVECYKIKLTKNPIVIDGEEVKVFEYHFFDTESFVIMGSEAEITSGSMKGKISITKLSDYQEVEGIYFPFSITSGIKDLGEQTLTFESIELNPEVDKKEFEFIEE